MNRFLQSRWLDGLWCLCLLALSIAGISNVPLHGDESTQIYMGRDFYYHAQGVNEQIVFRDWETLSPEEATEQQLRLLNGTLPKYLFGAVAYASGYTFEQINQQWVWGAGWAWNHANGHVPADDLLWRTRLMSAVLLGVSAVGVFLLGRTIGGRGVAYHASAYYTLNPAVLLNGRRAMMEGAMLAFTVLAVLMAVIALRRGAWRDYLLLGIVSGLAVASKHTAVVTIATLFVTGAIWIVYQRRAITQQITRLIVAGVLSLLVFFGLNPAWWANPPGAVRTVLELRQDLLTGQVGFFGGYETLNDQVTGFLYQSFIVLPMYAETDTDGFYSEQATRITRYDRSLVSGVSLGGSAIGAGVLIALVMIGCVYVWRSSRFDSVSRWVLSAWLLAMIILTLLLTPLEWQRYYLPIYPVIAIFGALGLMGLLTALIVHLNNRMQNG
ncbi:MAG: ArnT family glycosyltransferase [Anaerolineae bacterium]